MSLFEGTVMDGKVVLVSGVGPGLGSATAAAVLRAGGSVVLGDLDGVQLSTTAARLDPTGERCTHAEADISSRDDCERLVALARDRFGRLDSVVHVAAHGNISGGLMDGDLDDWERVSAVNVKGTLQLTKAAVPLLRDSGGGSIIIIGSIAAIHSVKGLPQILYGATKAALGAATHYLARELGSDGIRVNTLAPGWKSGARLNTDLAKRAASSGQTVDEFLEPVLADHPLKRFPDDEEVANVILFFCSDLAPSVTGQTLYIDGGLTA